MSSRPWWHGKWFAGDQELFLYGPMAQLVNNLLAWVIVIGMAALIR